jgi:stearoyl-CoA desaturase (delta-9 desaturase)
MLDGITKPADEKATRLLNGGSFGKRTESLPTLAYVLGRVMALPRLTQAAVTRGPIAHPETVDRRQILWPDLIKVIAFHLLLPLALVPWLFSWTGLLLIPIGNYLFCSMGIGAGYHRLLTHRSFRCPKWVEYTLAILGVCSHQGTPVGWVMIHRLHHQNSDHQPDPHSPLVSILWAHLEWLFVANRQIDSPATYERYVPDLLDDPFYMRLDNRMSSLLYAAHALLFFLAGLAIGWATTGAAMGGVQFGLSILLWGVVFRTIYTWHVIWGVNSLCHRWGYRNYQTDENSHNNWILALATNGEGWHNNHHADPRCANHGFHRWWELDITYLTLRGLQAVGLVSNLIPPRAHVAGSNLSEAIDDVPSESPNQRRVVRAARPHSAFSLVELLVVIAIVAVLIALLLPAVQSAREASRRSQCVNHMKQLGIAVQNYHIAHDMLPLGDNTLPPGPGPAEWKTNFSAHVRLLPYLEEQSLYDRFYLDTYIYMPRNVPLLGTSIELLHCPSERASKTSLFTVGAPPVHPDPFVVGHTNYMGSIGSRWYGFCAVEPSPVRQYYNGVFLPRNAKVR